MDWATPIARFGALSRIAQQKGLTVEPDASAESHPGSVTPSDGASRLDAGHEPNDTGHANSGLEQKESELKTAVSVATAQLGQDLHAVGSQLLNIETGHRALMERLKRIAEQADERALRQFQSAEHRFNRTEQQLHIAEQRIQAAEDKHQAVEQRLRAAEQENLASEQNWQRTDELLHTTWQQLVSAEQQLQTTAQQVQEVEQQLMVADRQIKTFGPQIKSCEQRVEHTTALFAEIKNMFDEQATRRGNVEISIGALAQEMTQLKAQVPKLAGDDLRLQSLQAMFRSNRRMQRVAVATSIVSLLIVGYIGLGKPGWPILARYLSLWVSGLPL